MEGGPTLRYKSPAAPPSALETPPVKVVHSPLHARHDGGKELHRGELVPCFEMPVRADVHPEGRGARRARGARAALRSPRSRCCASTTPGSSSSWAPPMRSWRALGKQGFMPAERLSRPRPAPGPHPLRHQRQDGLLLASTPARPSSRAPGKPRSPPRMSPSPPPRWSPRATRAPTPCAARLDTTPARLYGGYCFLNNAALAAQYLLDHGLGAWRPRRGLPPRQRHPGHLLRAAATCCSSPSTRIPADEYPYFLGYADERGAGAGDGYTLNLPLPRGTAWQEYSAALGARAGRHRDVLARRPGGVARRRHLRGRSHQRLQARPASTTRSSDSGWPRSKLPTCVRAGRRLRGG